MPAAFDPAWDDFRLIKAIADNLRKHPILNASVSGDNIVYRQAINIGIAVALDWGLIVPVLKNADELSLMGIAKRVADLAERARSKRLNPDEVQQGTFTITNPGVFGSYIGVPIINQPQVAILSTDGVKRRPVVVEAADGSEAIGIHPVGNLTLTWDHRAFDGAYAAAFLKRTKDLLESMDWEQELS